MPYNPAVTPDASPLERGAAALGAGFGERNERIRQEREKNEAADVTLEHLHSASPELLEPFLRRTGDTETPSAELLGRFLGSSTRAKKEGLIGAAAADALMRQRKLQQGLETTKVGNEGMRIAQQGQQNAEQRRQFDAEQRRLKTAQAMDHSERIRSRKAQAQITVTDLPGNGGTIVANGSGNFSFGAGRRDDEGFRPEPPEARAQREESARRGIQQVWNGKALVTVQPQPGMQFGPVPGAAAPGSPALPPIPAKRVIPAGTIQRHPVTGARYQFRGGDQSDPAAWEDVK